MKTTLILADPIARRLKEVADRRGVSMSRVVEETLLESFNRQVPRAPVKPLPTFRSGGWNVNIDSNAAIEDFLGDDEDHLHR
jgi:flagellar motor component MotA